MIFKNFVIKSLFLLTLVVGFMSCEKEVEMQTKTYSYSFNTGQADAAYAYSGSQANTIAAELMLEEMADGTTKVSVTLTGAIDSTYAVHAHDVVSGGTLPYNQTPNGLVYATPVVVSGGTGTSSQISTMSYEALTTTYDGFFVVHDPSIAPNTADPTTYVVLGTFAR
jgi:putative alpha-1,2-mannosidase